MMIPASLSLLNTILPAARSARSRSPCGAQTSAASPPSVRCSAALITTEWSWRWAFAINLPIGLDGALRDAWLHRRVDTRRLRHGRDSTFPGTLAARGRVRGPVVYGLIEGRQYGWWTRESSSTRSRSAGWTWPFANVSVSPVRHRLRRGGPHPVRGRRDSPPPAPGSCFLFDFTLWRFRGFRYGNHRRHHRQSLGEFGLLFALPLFLQGVLGYTAFETGLVFLVVSRSARSSRPRSRRRSLGGMDRAGW